MKEPDAPAHLLVNMPVRRSSWARELWNRVLLAFLILAVNTAIVYFDRGSYKDNATGNPLTFIDCLYYTTVTITTTGYGDLTPVAQHARLIGALIVTPLRILFLVLLVGTTLEVLANEGRKVFQDSRWRKRMRNHVVVIGYGTTGRSTIATLERNGIPKSQILVLDSSPAAVAKANLDGFAAIEGEAASRDLLRRAEIPKAREVVITVNRDDTAVLTTLTVRQLNPRAHVIVSVREQQNAALLRQSGANAIVTSSEMVGRLLGLSSISPNVGLVIEDLLTAGDGLEVAHRLVRAEEVGGSPDSVRGEQVVGVVRRDTLRRFSDPTVQTLETGDELIVVRQAISGPAKASE